MKLQSKQIILLILFKLSNAFIGQKSKESKLKIYKNNIQFFPK